MHVRVTSNNDHVIESISHTYNYYYNSILLVLGERNVHSSPWTCTLQKWAQRTPPPLHDIR